MLAKNLHHLAIINKNLQHHYLASPHLSDQYLLQIAPNYNQTLLSNRIKSEKWVVGGLLAKSCACALCDVYMCKSLAGCLCEGPFRPFKQPKPHISIQQISVVSGCFWTKMTAKTAQSGAATTRALRQPKFSSQRALADQNRPLTRRAKLRPRNSSPSSSEI